MFHIGAALVSGLILYVRHLQVMPVARLYYLFIYGLAMLGIYIGILYLMGEFTKEDWNYIMQTIHPGEMWRYIKDELSGNDSDEER